MRLLSVILIRKDFVWRQGSTCCHDNWIVVSDTIFSVRFATCGTSEVHVCMQKRHYVG